MTDDDELAWVGIGVASDVVRRVTESGSCEEQLAVHAAAGSLRSRASRVVYPDNLAPDDRRRRLDGSFWENSLALVRAERQSGQAEWLGGQGWEGGVVESAIFDTDTMTRPMHYRAHVVEFCVQDLLDRYPVEDYVAAALLQGVVPPLRRPQAPPVIQGRPLGSGEVVENADASSERAAVAAPTVAGEPDVPSARRPSLSEAAFELWVSDLKGRDVFNRLKLAELIALAKAMHPDKFVARSRVEALTKGRKRGPWKK